MEALMLFLKLFAVPGELAQSFFRLLRVHDDGAAVSRRLRRLRARRLRLRLRLRLTLERLGNRLTNFLEESLPPDRRLQRVRSRTRAGSLATIRGSYGFSFSSSR